MTRFINAATVEINQKKMFAQVFILKLFIWPWFCKKHMMVHQEKILFNFQDFGVKHIAMKVNGRSIPQAPYEPILAPLISLENT
jgi:hypothetical protein